jgi:fibronectin type 3 domain-containing protein
VASLATVVAGAWVVPSSAATSYTLRVSSSADRSAAQDLSGKVLSGRAYVFLAPPSSVKSVAFYVDDPTRTHKRHVDTTAPFDLKGGTASKAAPYFTTALRDGKHTVTAVITTTGGTKKVVSSSFTASNPTPKPKAVAAKAGNARVTLTWASGGGTTAGFNIYRSATSKIHYTKPLNAKPLPKTASRYVDKTPKNGVKYWYVVRAVSSKHRPTSSAKVSARPLVPPKTPSSVIALAGDSKVKVSWSNGGGSVQGWRIYRGTASSVSLTTPLTTLKASARSFTDTGVTNGTTYYYVVQAYADKFTAKSPSVPATPIPAPDTVTATPDDQRVTLAWHIGPGDGAITGFKVYVGTTAAVSTTGTPAASTSHAEVRSLAVVKDGKGDPLVNGKTYYFRVVSVSATGKAPAAAVRAVPVPAIGLTATPSSGQVLLTWNTTGPDTTSYEIFRADGTAAPSTGSGAVPLTTITDKTATSYSDLSVVAGATYTYVVVAVSDTWTSKSPAKSAKAPAIGYGPTASGWGGNLAPTNQDWPAGPVKTALGSTLTDFRYVFNRIGTTNIDKTDILHVKPCADLTLTNHGGGAVTINSMSTSGPYELVYSDIEEGCPGGTPISFPYSLAGGSSIKVEVRFDYCRGNTPATTCSAASLPPKGVQYGLLTINSNDPGHTVTTLPLAGAWQATAGGADELPLASFVNQTLGITTQLTGGRDAQGAFKGINYGNGLVVATGSEVLSPYWRATGGSVSVRQIIATHSQGGHEPLVWYPQGSPASVSGILSQAGTDYQTLLPGGSNGPRAEGSFSPGAQPFGFRVNSGTTADWSDDTFNTGTMANDYKHGCPMTGPCGHHVRFFPLRDPNGNVTDAWLMCVDSQGVNLDYNDVDYVITGITPA